jgi:hypothetical protein
MRLLNAILKKGRIYVSILIQKPYKPLNAYSVQAITIQLRLCDTWMKYCRKIFKHMSKDIIKYVDWCSVIIRSIKNCDYLTFTVT